MLARIPTFSFNQRSFETIRLISTSRSILNSNSQPQPSSSSSSPSSSYFSPPPPKQPKPINPTPVDPNSASARHKSFYSDILPPFLRVLAYGSASYFALHLTWTVLKDGEIKQEREQEIDGLQKVVKESREKILKMREQVVADEGKVEETSSGKSWWKLW